MPCWLVFPSASVARRRRRRSSAALGNRKTFWCPSRDCYLQLTPVPAGGGELRLSHGKQARQEHFQPPAVAHVSYYVVKAAVLGVLRGLFSVWKTRLATAADSGRVPSASARQPYPVRRQNWGSFLIPLPPSTGARRAALQYLLQVQAQKARKPLLISGRAKAAELEKSSVGILYLREVSVVHRRRRRRNPAAWRFFPCPRSTPFREPPRYGY